MNTFPVCCGNCNQGRRPCVTPQACQLPDNEDAAEQMNRIPGAGVVVVPVAFAVAAVAAWRLFSWVFA